MSANKNTRNLVQKDLIGRTKSGPMTDRKKAVKRGYRKHKAPFKG